MAQLMRVVGSKIIFFGHDLSQNVTLFLETRQGSLEPPSDRLLKDGLAASPLAPCPTEKPSE